MKKKTVVILIISIIAILTIAGFGYYHLKYVYGAPEAVSIRELQETNEAYDYLCSTYGEEAKKYDYVVLVNPAHGGQDKGVTVENLYEKSITLSVAAYLKNLGMTDDKRVGIFLTRATDTNLTVEQRASFEQLIEADMIVDIHVGSSDNPTDMGVTTYYSSGFYDYRLTNEQFADNILRGIVNATGTKAVGVLDSDEEDYAFLKGRQIPTIAVNIGYISNPEEREALASDAYVQNIARGIMDGLQESLDMYETNGGNKVE